MVIRMNVGCEAKGYSLQMSTFKIGSMEKLIMHFWGHYYGGQVHEP